MALVRDVLAGAPMKSIVFLAAALLLACGGATESPSSSSTTTSSPTSPGDRAPADPPAQSGTVSPGEIQGGGQPDDACMPAGTKAGDACSAEGQSCSAVEWCDAKTGALVTDGAAMTCTSGAWTRTGGTCPAAGDVNSEGCPLTQPDGGTSCTVDGAKCHYGMECVIGDCNGAPNCVPAKKVSHGWSECSAGAWMTTTALAACP